LVLPILLVISQYVSMELMTPKTQDPAQQQSNVILKVLPIMIGWFSLSVPSALSVYWFVNNIITTATSMWIRSSIPPPQTVTPGATAQKATSVESIFAPPRERPSGFERKAPAPDDIKPITAIDAEVVVENVKEAVDDAVEAVTSSGDADKKGKKARGSKKRKKN
jgi:YidC/Oxa1 family membrane protein insertase